MGNLKAFGVGVGSLIQDVPKLGTGAKLANGGVKYGTKLAGIASKDILPTIAKDTAKQAVKTVATVPTAFKNVGQGVAKSTIVGASTIVKAAKAATPEAVVHEHLVKTNPGYAALQNTLEQSTAAANKINQMGGSKIALAQHTKNIADVQNQMAFMRRDAAQKGSINPDYSAVPGGNSSPKRTGAGNSLGDTSSNASKASSSIPSVSSSKALLQPSTKISSELITTPRLTSASRQNLPSVNTPNTLVNNTTQQRGLTQSIQSSNEFSPELKRAITSTPNHSNLAEKALQADQNAADAIAVMKAHDAAGNTQAAQQVHDLLAQHGETGGQFINAGKPEHIGSLKDKYSSTVLSASQTIEKDRENRYNLRAYE